MDRETAKRLAELINTEQLDLISFEATAGEPDKSGKRPTLQAIQERRQAEQDQARKNLEKELAQTNPDHSQAMLPATQMGMINPPPGSYQGQLVETIQPAENVTSDIADQDLVQSCRSRLPVDPGDDLHIDTRSPTPIDTKPTAATTSPPSCPIMDAGQEPEPDTSAPSSESFHPLEVSEEQITLNASSPTVESPSSAEESIISPGDQTSQVHGHQHGQSLQSQSSPRTPHASHKTIQGSSSPITPTQASFNASFAPAPVRPPMNHMGLWQNLKWAYLTHTRADIELQCKGIWLFEKPLACQTKESSSDLGGLQLQPSCPVVISCDLEDRSEQPYLEHNDTALTMYTHLPPWTNDPRSIENFAGLVPDFQSEVPLTEYQTLEALGSHVWRHDRELLPCRGPACKKMLSDMATTTLICLGCGPKSIVRFCSVRCHLASLPQHVLECWHPHLLIHKLIDENSAPPRFSHLAPSLRDRHGYRTYQNYRQRVAAQYAVGRYSLFNPATEEATVLIWDKRFDSRDRHRELPYAGYATEMESRVERCLNVALFDHTNTPVIEHLYRLLQLCLQGKDAWNSALATVLARQFRLEFEYDAQTSLRVQARASFCECEWEGGAVQLHEATCSSRYRGQGEVILGQRSVRDVVEAMENRYWILRAWRRQLRTEDAWNRRVMGAGFPGAVVEEGWTPKLGKGWVGYNGEDDDVIL
ncbi:MAG: hypothetical protein LQ339_003910 [Xanthoria mediterranea]|nr:MAG: hypothetical protein LQ339_003910 [Xanthoria mediterranea]